MRGLDFNKGNGLLPVIIQEEKSNEVLMLGFMNLQAWLKTKEEKRVWFYSRSKGRLWMKGESSGNVLLVKKIKMDCDRDSLLIQVEVKGPVCHLGVKSCFEELLLSKEEIPSSIKGGRSLVPEKTDSSANPPMKVEIALEHTVQTPAKEEL